MAHQEQIDYIDSLKNKFQDFFKNKKVLEVGSFNINGTARTFFDDCDYTGLDLEEGTDVDIVCEAQEYDAPDESYEVVFSANCFEHNPYWKETFLNMIRLCKSEGLVFFTCASDGHPEHGTIKNGPQDSPFTINKGWGDYYRNLNEIDFSDINMDQYFSEFEFSINQNSHDLYFYGTKK